MALCLGTPLRCAASVAAKFFDHLDHPFILLWMLRAAGQARKAQLFQHGADIALMKLDAEALLDDTLYVHPSPPHDPVGGRIRTGLNDVCELLLLVRR